MITRIEVTKGNNETPGSLIRRFTRRVQESGMLRRAKGKRYSKRELSTYKEKQATLRKLVRRAEVEKLKRLGKMADVFVKKHH